MKWSLFFLLLSFDLFAYVINETSNGEKLKWNKGNRIISIKLDTQLFDNSTSELSPSAVQSAFDLSLSEFTSIGDYRFEQVQSSSADAKVKFSNNSAIFGSGVLAVTVLTFSDDSGNISEGEILINDSFSAPYDLVFSKNSSDDRETYIGNVLTHELGHLMGLDHSEVIDSTMFYNVFKGQDSLSSDDHFGLKENYGVSAGKTASGRIVGRNFRPVKNAHVQLFEVETNKVIQGTLSKKDGSFEFSNLEIDKKYFISVGKLYNPSAITVAEDAKYDFCQQSDIVMSFFTGCQGENKFHPNTFSLTENIDLGDITVRCDPNINSLYLGSKLDDEYFEIDSRLRSGLFVGYFLPSEIDSKVDKLKIDLRSVVDTTFDQIINMNFNLSNLYSLYEVEMKVRREDQTAWTTISSSINGQLNKKEVDLEIELALSSVAEDNIFYIEITPLSQSYSEQVDIVSSPQLFTEKNNHYLLSYAVENDFESFSFQDNRECLEGNVYSDFNNTSNISENPTSSGASPLSVASCATIRPKKGPSGAMSFVMGLVLILGLVFSRNMAKSLSRE